MPCYYSNIIDFFSLFTYNVNWRNERKTIMPDVWSEFFKEGFFGYGEKGDFQYFSIWHFLPILILIAGIILTYIFRDKIADSKHEKTFRLILGCTMLLAEFGFFWRLLYVGPGDTVHHTMMTKLPIQVCEWTCIFAAIMVFTENKHFFDIDATICLTLGVAPLLLPAVILDSGPKYFRYYQFWLEHIIPIYSVFYMMFIKGLRYDIKKIYKPLTFLCILAAISMVANYFIPEASYMYLQGDALGPAITSILPSNQFARFGVFTAVTLLLFGIEFLIFYLIRRYRKKKEDTPIEPVENN